MEEKTEFNTKDLKDLLQYAVVKITTSGMDYCSTVEELDLHLGNVHKLRKALDKKYFSEIMSIYKKNLKRIRKEQNIQK